MCTQSSGGGVAMFVVVRNVADVPFVRRRPRTRGRRARLHRDQCPIASCRKDDAGDPMRLTINHETASNHVGIDSATPSIHAK